MAKLATYSPILMNINKAFEKIKELGTNGYNCEVNNEDILNKLEEWNKALEIEVLEVTEDSVTIHFKSLPGDTKKFAQEIYEFCPDVVDQHFGCFGEMFESMEELGEEIPEATKRLIEGIDFSSDHYGLDLLEKALKIDGRIQLWWD